ncbi:MAG TPA: FapA family protein [Chitinispirillaceae bacterium]|nr:FapA family protein [Chitinispirillaceae bacterium]
MNENNKNGNEDADALFERLNEQLKSIEWQEILDNVSTDTLLEQGLTSDDPVSIDRIHHERKIAHLNLCLASDIDYMELPLNLKLEHVSYEDISHLKIIKKGALIGFYDSTLKTRPGIGNNITAENADNKDQLFATVDGRLLISGNMVHIFPADIDSAVKFTVANDKMKIFMDCSPALGNGHPLTVQMVRDLLNQQKITHGIKIVEIEKAIAEANKNCAPQRNILVAEGSYPVNGKDGNIKFNFDTTQTKMDFTILPDGRIDYKSSLNLMLVKKGDLLGVIEDPKPGLPGLDVFNNPIPCESGVPANIIPGTGVDVSKNKKEFFANTDGCIMYNRPSLSVVDTYVVKGDVDYSTGNINFNGIVIVCGNVPDGFEIRADGDIIVCKNVEAARLIAGRDIIIKGGVQGKGKGLISAGRDIFAEYAQNGRLEAQGSIEIGNFSINSYIATTNQLKLLQKRGAFIGGELYALKGIDVRSLGSEQGVKTYVEIGTDFLVLKKINELNQIFTLISANLSKIDQTLKTVSTALKKDPSLISSRKPLIEKAIAKRKEIENNKNIIQVKIDQLKEQLHYCESCFAKILDACYSDVTIKIRNVHTTITKPRNNIRFYEDTEAGRVGCKFY